MKNFVVMVSMAALLGCSSQTEEIKEDTGEVTQEAHIAAPNNAGDATPPDMEYYCAPQAGMTPICGFKSPEDAEWLPDGSAMIVSEYGNYEFEGTIKLLNHNTGEAVILWDATHQTAGTGTSDWGDEEVTQKAKFSPHGINLSQRSDGAWQLLVVNHAETETIDFFELVENDGNWSLEWRGGVDADEQDFYNDVAAVDNGFYTTRFFIEKMDNLFVDYSQKIENGIVKKWTPHMGWTELEGTRGLILNGILWNEAADELVVNEWGKGKVNIFSGDGKKKFSYDGIPHPDNVSWNDSRDAYLVASKSVDITKLVECGVAGLEVCEGEFNIFEIQPEGGPKTIRYTNDGKFWGPPSNAIENDDKLYIGSFGGSRILVVE